MHFFHIPWHFNNVFYLNSSAFTTILRFSQVKTCASLTYDYFLLLFIFNQWKEKFWNCIRSPFYLHTKHYDLKQIFSHCAYIPKKLIYSSWVRAKVTYTNSWLSNRPYTKYIYNFNHICIFLNFRLSLWRKSLVTPVPIYFHIFMFT